MEKKHDTFTVLGIDPGTNSTGYGLLQKKGSEFITLDYGCIRPPRKEVIEKRNQIMFESICTLLDQYPVDAFSVENQYVNKNLINT